MWILIVDDDALVLRSLVRGLRAKGHVVVKSERPILCGQYDAVLIDWQPYGPAQVAECVAVGVPFVVLTAAPHLVPDGLPVLAKPATIDEIERALQRAAGIEVSGVGDDAVIFREVV